MENCEICPILATKNNDADVIVLETERWRAVLDPDQRFLGKIFLTLRDHRPSLSELSLQDWQELHQVMKQLEGSVMRAFSPTHFNWSCLMNNAVMASQPTHVHWHLHPRYKESVVFGGEIFEDTELYPPKRRTTHPVSRDLLQRIAEAINS